jgi:hypothetical protein
MIKNCAFFFSLLAVIAITQNVGLSQEPASMVRDEYLHAYNLHDDRRHPMKRMQQQPTR